MAKIHPGGPFQKGVFVEFSHFGSRPNTAIAAFQIGAKGGPLPAIFVHGFKGWSQNPLQLRGYCTSVASEMSCVMQIRAGRLQIRVCHVEMGRS